MKTAAEIHNACLELARRDDELRFVFEKHGPPSNWIRPASFSSLVLLILEQQVSLSSANAAFVRLKNELGYPLPPDLFLTLSDEKLREIGFSRQKTGYARGLAEAILSEKLKLDSLENLDDETVKTELKKLKGIGDWTAQIFLIACLQRSDVLPRGDIALLEAIKILKKLEARPSHDLFEKMTDHWRPFRTIGCRLLWRFYLKEIRPVKGDFDFLDE